MLYKTAYRPFLQQPELTTCCVECRHNQLAQILFRMIEQYSFSCVIGRFGAVCWLAPIHSRSLSLVRVYVTVDMIVVYIHSIIFFFRFFDKNKKKNNFFFVFSFTLEILPLKSMIRFLSVSKWNWKHIKKQFKSVWLRLA